MVGAREKLITFPRRFAMKFGVTELFFTRRQQVEAIYAA
jgi:hypothetical protein